MKLSIFTPLSESGNRYIAETARSVYAAARRWGGEIEWVVCPNHGGDSNNIPWESWGTLNVVGCPEDLEGIGAIKRFACEQCTGDVLIELDHDDILAPDALIEIAAAFECGADFVYSDFAEFRSEDFAAQWDMYPYGSAYGWRHYPVRAFIEGEERPLIAMHAAPVTPQNLRLVDWAPNHVRAWRRSTYERVGGHDVNLPVADDHDLVVRTFLSGARMVRIPRCLYYYRVHKSNTVTTQNALVREATEAVYDQHVEALALKFCECGLCGDSGWADTGDGSAVECRCERKPRAVDMCGGPVARDGLESWDIQLGHDLRQRWPAENCTVGYLRAVDALEHLPDIIHTWREAYRVLAPGGFFRTLTPSTDGRGAWQDPTHVSFWNSNSFWYVTRAEQQRYVPALAGVRFAVARLRNVYATEWHRTHNIVHVQADLIKLGPGYNHMGEVLI